MMSPKSWVWGMESDLGTLTLWRDFSPRYRILSAMYVPT
jgi:hypothetical protein